MTAFSNPCAVSLLLALITEFCYSRVLELLCRYGTYFTVDELFNKSLA